MDTVLRLYYFDFELRLLLLKYISRIEIHLRTTIVNYMSAKHNNKDTWFVDDAIVSPAYIRSFGSIYDRVRLSTYIKWHHHNHSCKYTPQSPDPSSSLGTDRVSDRPQLNTYRTCTRSASCSWAVGGEHNDAARAHFKFLTP